MNEVHVEFRLNGEPVAIDAPSAEMLLDTVRDRFGLTGSNQGCDHASCGACTMLVDGSPRASCSTFTWAVEGGDVTTIDGVGTTDCMSPVQAAFAEVEDALVGGRTSSLGRESIVRSTT